MSDELIVRHCAPTLAGLKAGSLFSCPCPDVRTLTGELRRLNRTLAPKGLRVLPLRAEKGRALIYLYRPLALERELRGREARALLEERGYGPDAAPPLPGAAGPQTAGRGDVPPRDRAVFELPARGRAGFHLQRGLPPQMCRLLEGLRRRSRRPAHLRDLATLHPHLQPAAGAGLPAGTAGSGRLTLKRRFFP